MKHPFVNEPLTDFRDPTNRDAFRRGLDAVMGRIGRSHPLVIGGEVVHTADSFPSLNPANPAQVVGHVAKATPELAQRAIEAAATAFETWRQVPYAERSRYLFSAASIIRARKHELSALIMLEVGKTWDEADGETAEAIDFLEFYGREMLRLGPPQPTVSASDREIELMYVPLGVGIVIPPWNFPAAITFGLATAAIVSGNTVVLKPASSSPVTAAWLADLFNETLHLPPGVLNYLPGSGSAIGDTLLDHPLTRFVAFTGSKEVGQRIFERAARVQPGQKWLKRTILEMGGKNAILVDETADLDAAAAGIVAAAFGFSGQKCSACSRLIAVDAIYEPLVEKVVERARALQLGDPSTGPEITVGPVIEHRRCRSISSTSPLAAARADWCSVARLFPRRPPATSLRRRSSRISRRQVDWLRRKSSGRCWPASARVTSKRVLRSPTTPSTGLRARCTRCDETDWSERAATFMSGTSTSTGSAPARSLARSPSAGST